MGERISPKSIKLLKYILNNTSNKVPIKRVDMTNSLGIPSKEFNSHLTEVQDSLLSVYGLKLVQVPDKTPLQYICISTLKPVSELEYTSTQRADMTLLYLVLSFILMKAGSVTEEILLQYLKKLEIPFDDVHDHFGSVKKKLTEVYVKQQYLRREKRVIDGTNEEEIIYSWGARSTLEFPKEKVISIVAELLEKPASCFMSQYNIADEEL